MNADFINRLLNQATKEDLERECRSIDNKDMEEIALTIAGLQSSSKTKQLLKFCFCEIAHRMSKTQIFTGRAEKFLKKYDAETTINRGFTNPLGTLLAILKVLGAESVDVSLNLEVISNNLISLKGHETIIACNVLTKYPSEKFVPGLRKKWFQLDDQIREAYIHSDDEQNRELDPHTEEETAVVSATLGACAIHLQPKNFQYDENVTMKLQRMREEYKQLIDGYNAMIKSMEVPIEPWMPEVVLLRSLKDRIINIENEIRNEQEEIRQKLSPGFLLLLALNDEQMYPVAVRQGAAWGLHLIRKQGNIDEDAKARIFESIRSAVTDDKSIDFCEKRIQLFDDSELPDLVNSLRNGLRWMVEIAEGEYANKGIPHYRKEQAEGMKPYERLDGTVILLDKYVPGLMGFLKKYPLRLMRLDHHMKVLGNFVQKGCDIEFWTRYTPPKNVGQVHRRYIEICDRSTPNSMGIYYRLFRHSILVIPVVYHEFLHYRGLKNEAEVIMREIVFARGLIAKFAPNDYNFIPQYEMVLIKQIIEVDMIGLIMQLFFDFRDDKILTEFNMAIAATYGRQLRFDEAEKRIEKHIILLNLLIKTVNLQIIWCRNIMWPLLGRPETHPLTERFKNILREHRIRRNDISPKERDNIMNDSVCRESIQAWESYLKKPNTLKILKAKKSELILIPLDILNRIVRRFPFEPSIL